MYPGTYAAATPDKIAAVMAGTGETLTYGDLERRSSQLAHVLHDAGLRPAAAAGPPSDRARRWPGRAGQHVLRGQRGFGVPVARADLSRGPVALERLDAGPRRHRRDDEAVRRRANASGHPGSSRHPRAV